jgi:UDP:flavonoid glycosyltransferase YjiC (YdhE family)
MQMNTVLFAVPPEPGHILPCLTIARKLSELGYAIVFVTSPEFFARFRAQGFQAETYEIEYAVGDMPRPFYWATASGHSLWERSLPTNVERSEKRGKVLERRVCELALEYGARAIVLDRLFCTSYHVSCEAVGKVAPIVLLWTSLPNWTEHIPDCDVLNLVLCPEEFEIPCFRRQHPNAVFAEPSIDVNREEVEWEPVIDHGAGPLVLCAFGTQTQRHADSGRLISALVGAAERLPSLRFALAAGSGVSAAQHDGQLPANVSIAPFIPQLHLMASAALFVSHGGLGGLKEALFKGVPSLVIPLGYDQPYNAARILHFGLGDAMSSQEVSAQTLAPRINGLANNPSVSTRARNFRKLFEERERDARAAKLIDVVAKGTLSRLSTSIRQSESTE